MGRSSSGAASDRHSVAVRKPLHAGGADQLLEQRHPFADPRQFLGRDLVVRRVTRVDIGLPQQLEAAAREAVLRSQTVASSGATCSACERRKFSRCDFGL